MIELLITMGLLSVVFTGLIALQTNVIRQVTINKRHNEATRLAQSLVNNYRVMSFTNIVPTAGAWQREFNRNTSEMVNVGVDGIASGPFTADTMIEASGNGLIVTVRVTWTSVVRTNSSAQPYQQGNVTLSTARYP